VPVFSAKLVKGDNLVYPQLSNKMDGALWKIFLHPQCCWQHIIERIVVLLVLI